MTIRNILSVYFILAFSIFLISESAKAQDKILLSTILKSIEEREPGVIANAEYDEDLWEIEICDSGKCQKLYIDPITGQEIRRRSTDEKDIPQPNSVLISVIAAKIESTNGGKIKEIEFDDGYWEAEIKKDGQRNKLYFNSATGEQVPGRLN